MMDERRLRRSRMIFLILSVLLLSTAQGVISYLAVIRFKAQLVPEIERKVDLVGSQLSGRIAMALQFDHNLGALRGKEAFVQRELQRHPELTSMAIQSMTGEVIYEGFAAAADEGDPVAAEELSVPITIDDKPVGTLRLGIDGRYAERTLKEMTYDVLTVLAISLMITFGLMSFIIQSQIAGRVDAILAMMNRIGQGDLRPQRREQINDRIGSLLDRLNGVVNSVRRLYEDTLSRLETLGAQGSLARQALLTIGHRNRLIEQPADDTPLATRLVVLRVVVFVFFLAEEMIRPFLPLYIKDLAGGMGGALINSLPFSLFILVAAAAQPWGGMWAERVGRKRVFTVAAGLCVVSLVLAAVAQNYWQLLLWRTLGAIGYGAVFSTCQGYAVDITSPVTRARGMVMFVGGVMAAGVCGPSIGGILADHFGSSLTLVMAAGVSFAGLLGGRSIMSHEPEYPDRQGGPTGWREFVAVLGNRRLMILMVLVSVPAKILLTGALFYLTPLFLSGLGATPSSVGRAMMVYGIATVLLGPLAARYADAYRQRRHWIVGLGAVLAGLGFLPMEAMPHDVWVLGVAIAFLGIGQALGISVQLALVTDYAEQECEEYGASVVLGVFRFVERAGGALGPFFASLLAEAVGNAGALAWLGRVSITLAVLFLLSTFVSKTARSAGVSATARTAGTEGQ